MTSGGRLLRPGLIARQAKEVTYLAAELRQHVLAGKLLVLFDDIGFLSWPIDRHVSRLRVDQPNEANAVMHIIHDFPHHLAEAVAGRKDLDGNPGRNFTVFGMQLRKRVRVLIESYIGSANGVRIALQDNAG